MVEPPPIIDGAQAPVPTPSVWKALGVSCALFATLLLLANLVSVPFLLLVSVDKTVSNVLNSRTTTIEIDGKFDGRALSQLGESVEHRFPDAVVSVSARRPSGVELSIRPKTLGSSTAGYEEGVRTALSATTVKAPKIRVKHPRRRDVFTEIMSDPMIIVIGAFSTQVSIVAIWLYLRRKGRPEGSDLPPFHQGSVVRAVLIGAVAGVFVAFGANWLDDAFRLLFHVSTTGAWESTIAGSPAVKILAISMAVVGAPILEEVFFRGILIGQFQRIDRAGLGVCVSSVLFGVAHMQDIATILTITCMGLVLGTVYLRTRSLYATVTLHMVNNAVSFWILLRSSA